MCWQTYLPCSKRYENIINRTITTCYIETIPKKHFATPKQNIFRVQKFSNKKNSEQNLKMFVPKNVIFFRRNDIFSRNLENANFQIFFQIFSNSDFFQSWEKIRYSFDVKIYDLSIYDVFRAFGAQQTWFPAPTRYCEGTKICSIPRVFSRSVCLGSKSLFIIHKVLSYK